MKDLFGNEVPPPLTLKGRYGTNIRNKWGVWLVNPMSRLGFTPGRICKECENIILSEYRNRRHYKCKLRGVTRGGQTDHRLKWPACPFFEPNLECRKKMYMEKKLARERVVRYNVILATIIFGIILISILLWIFT